MNTHTHRFASIFSDGSKLFNSLVITSSYLMVFNIVFSSSICEFLTFKNKNHESFINISVYVYL